MPVAMDLDTWIHQAAFIKAAEQYPRIPYIFLIGGYGCGKSFSGVLIILAIYEEYNGHEITVGVGGTSQTLLRKTLLADLFRVLKIAGIRYSHNKQEHTFRIGTVEYVYISMADPDTIFAYNFSIFIGDELDELPQEKAIESFKAVQERTRITLPPTKTYPEGREPYALYMTTAQGLKGTYRIIMDLDEAKIPYIKIRGETRHNLSLSKTYVARLYALYTAVEAEAFLEGKFVNLYTGRVYPEYNDVKHLYMPFPLTDDDILYVGQDLNSGFSKGVVFVERGGCIYGVAEFSFSVVADAPRIIRNNFPSQQIFWLPDASAKEIMRGYISEIEDANIELVQRNINPSVTERILVVNKLFRLDLLKLFTTLKQWSIALKTRQFDDDGKPSKGKGALSPDHICDAAEYALWYIVQISKSFKELKDLLRLSGRAA